ncbi:unnamed protein product, partial [Rotaria sp. Silwood1]
YSTFTATMVKSANQGDVELMIRNIVSITCYIAFACPFFVFFASSKSFRQEAKILFLCRKPAILQRNQIQPYSTSALRKIRSISTRINQMPSYYTTRVNNIKPITINEK